MNKEKIKILLKLFKEELINVDDFCILVEEEKPIAPYVDQYVNNKSTYTGTSQPFLNVDNIYPSITNPPYNGSICGTVSSAFFNSKNINL
jgi:hypothetical protein